MQYTEFMLRNRRTGELKKLRAFIDPERPLRDELGIYYVEFDILGSRNLNYSK